jgi:hypothetical protein
MTEGLNPELVRRLRQALTGTAEELFQILQDPAPEVLRTALKNRQLTEEHLLFLLKRRDLPEDLLKAIYQRNSSSASHQLQTALVRNPSTPGSIVLSLLPHLYLFELLNLCLLPGTTPDLKLAAEQQIIKRLPTVPLGNKLTLARRATPNLLGELLRSGEPQVFTICLDSPRLKEISVLQFLSSPRANAESISAIARHPRWKSRPNLRLTILRHPQTPAIWFTLFLPQLNRSELQTLASSNRATPQQKKLLQEELRKRSGTAGI